MLFGCNSAVPLVFFLPFFTLCHPSPNYKPTWTPLANITPFGRQQHSTVFLPPCTVAIFGGFISINDSVLTTDHVQFYSITENTWTTKAALPRPLSHVNGAVVDGKVYVLGGLIDDPQGQQLWRAVPDSWVYEPSKNLWSPLPPMPVGEERGKAAVGVHNSRIYLAGGITELVRTPNGTQKTVSTVSIFDTDTQTWLHVPPTAKDLPEARDHAGGAVVASNFYVLGGRLNGQNNVKNTVFVLDLQDRAASNLSFGWRTSSSHMPTARGSFATGTIRSRIYTFGGEGNLEIESSVFDQVEVYDTITDNWKSIGKMRIPRHGMTAVGVGGRVYVPGGGLRQGGRGEQGVADFDAFAPYPIEGYS